MEGNRSMVQLRLRAVGAALLGLVLLLPVLAVPATAAGPRSNHDRIVAYWTRERIASAKPRDVLLDAGKFRVANRVAPAPQPLAAPANTTGSQWPDGVGRAYRAIGRVLFKMGTGHWICSAVAATDARADISVVLTAAHCAYDQATGAFASNWIFIPEFDTAPELWDCTKTAHGCWTANRLVVHRGYAGQRSFNQTAIQHDWAFAVVGNGGKTNTQLDATVGSYPISFTSSSSGTKVTAMGYPAGGKYSPGNELVYCSGPVGSDPYTFYRTYRLACDMTGGSSGGPWFTGFDANGNTGTLSSVNSYGYSGITAMHGPKFGTRTRDTWNAAIANTSGNTIVR
jgi:V8-like Glu-specific endopeptidase